MLKWLVNSGWWLENRHFRECRKPRCCHPGLRAGIASVKSSWRPAGAIGSIAVLFALVFLSACTDYVSQIEDRYGEWNVGQVYVPAEESSSSVAFPMSSWSGGGAGAIGSITDSRDGQSYKTVVIGTQTWMAQNLNYETANSYCYSDNASNCTKYGRFYTWAAATSACPSGWHLPTQTEWNTLFTAVGGQSTAGNMLKSTSGWNSSGNGTDAYSFSALPAGYRGHDGSYHGGGDDADFWSSTELNDNDAYYVNLYGSNDDALLGNSLKNYGLSVRCVKDDVLKGISSSSVELKSSSSNKNVATSSSNGAVKSSSSVKLSSVTDSRDGQSYKTVVIGTQTWMAQNLNYETANSYCYGDSPSNCTKYGRLYTWAAAMDSAGTWSANGKGCGYNKTCSPTYPVRGVCPTGWHLPTKAEFETLITAVGGSSTAGTKLKSTSGWNEFEGKSGNGVDAYSFSALPAGYRYHNGSYDNGGYYALFWSSTELSSGHAYSVYLYYYYDSAGLNDNDEIYGFSVRCVKDEKFSPSATKVKSSSSKKMEQSSSSVIPSSSSLTPSSSSVAQSVVDPSAVVVGSITDTRDGQSYKTVTIGSQTWMAENLNYETADSYCYSDNASNCTKYGRFYTWAAAMDSVGTWSTNGKGCGFNKTCSPTYPVRGVCPEGWHLPTQTEWNTLFTAVGGQSTAGNMLKSTNGWYSSGNGTDAYSFSALPAGTRDNFGYYNNEGNGAYFWSSTEYSNYDAYYMNLNYGGGNAYLRNNVKSYGFSVRCVKD